MPMLSPTPSLTLSPASTTSDNSNQRPFAGRLLRVRGLAWTTNRAIAARFALGHRGIAVPNPVICKARCSAIFMRPRGRGEREAILDPAHLKAIEVFSIAPLL